MKTNMPIGVKCRLATLGLGKKARETPSARQKKFLPDGKPLVIYVKKKKNSLINSFPASCIMRCLQPKKHLQAKAVSLY